MVQTRGATFAEHFLFVGSISICRCPNRLWKFEEQERGEKKTGFEYEKIELE